MKITITLICAFLSVISLAQNNNKAIEIVKERHVLRGYSTKGITFVAEKTIESSQKLTGNSKVSYIAQNRIRLSKGFSASIYNQSGDSILQAKLTSVDVLKNMGMGSKCSSESTFVQNISPCPANEKVTISFVDYDKDIALLVELFNICGNKVKQTEIDDFNDVRIQIDVSDLTDRIYILKVTYDNKTEVKKVIVKHRFTRIINIINGCPVAFP